MKWIVASIFIMNCLTKALSCSCLMFEDKIIYLNSTKYVFTGKVIELIEAPYADTSLPEWMEKSVNRQEYFDMLYPKRYSAIVIMINNLKTTKPTQDTLFFEHPQSNCDPNYKLNESYLFFAEEAGSGKFKMVHCTPWGSIKSTEETILLYESYKK